MSSPALTSIISRPENRYANYPEGSIDDSPVLRQKNPNVFFPPEFFPVIRADLNGTFFCNYDIDGDGNVTKHSLSNPLPSSSSPY